MTQKKKKPVITDPSQLTSSLPELFEECANESAVTLTGEGFEGTLIIDGWKAHEINIGNNCLSYLVIKNCPNLHTLRYAHK